VTLLIGFALQVQSLEELERRAKVCFKKLLPRKQRRIDLTGRIGLRVHEFATAINVAPRTVYAWIDHGELEAEKHGRIYIIPAKVVKKFTGGDNIN
jgi:excisionase family DNA binding protein